LTEKLNEALTAPSALRTDLIASRASCETATLEVTRLTKELEDSKSAPDETALLRHQIVALTEKPSEPRSISTALCSLPLISPTGNWWVVCFGHANVVMVPT